MPAPNTALFPNNVAVPDVDTANPGQLDPGGYIWEPREGVLRILGAWNLINVSRGGVLPASPAPYQIHIDTPSDITGGAMTQPSAVIWDPNSGTWAAITPELFSKAVLANAGPITSALSTDAGNDLVPGTDGAPFFAETVTALTYNAAAKTISYVDEAGNTTVVDLAALATDVYVTNAVFNPSTLMLRLQDNSASTPHINVNLGQLLGSFTGPVNGVYTYNAGNGNTYAVDTKDGVSADAGNDLSLGADGKPYFAQALASVTGPVAGVYTIADGNGNTYAVDTKDGVSTDANNALTLGADGKPFMAALEFATSAELKAETPTSDIVRVDTLAPFLRLDLTRMTCFGELAGDTATGLSVTAVGYRAGSTSTGNNLSAVGYDAGYGATATDVSAVGRQAGYQSASQFSVNEGYQSGYQGGSAATYAVNIGYQSGYQAAGIAEVSIGYNAGRSVLGDYQVSVGRQAGYQSNSAGLVAVGNNAAYQCTVPNTVCVGSSSGFQITQAGTFVGVQAGYQSAALNAVGVGLQAGLLATGTQAVSVGQYAGQESQTQYQISVGALAGEYLTGLSQNIAIGYTALRNGVADQATVVGGLAGRGSALTDCVLAGYRAFPGGTASRLTAIGVRAGVTPASYGAPVAATPIVGGRFVTATGHGFGAAEARVRARINSTTQPTIATGPVANGTVLTLRVVDADTLEYLTITAFVTSGAGVTLEQDITDYTNVTLLGADAQATGPNQVVLGDSNVTLVRTYGDIWANGTTYPSDKRLKTDFKTISAGLEIVQKLTGYTFNWDSESTVIEPEHVVEETIAEPVMEWVRVDREEVDPTSGEPVVRPTKVRRQKVDENGEPVFEYRIEKRVVPARRVVSERTLSQRQIGLIAQEVQPLVPEAVSEGPDGFLAVDYPKLIPVLVQAIKELSARVEALEMRK